MCDIKHLIRSGGSGFVIILFLAAKSMLAFGPCTGYEGRKLSLEEVEKLAKGSGFACRNLAEVIALLSVEAEERNGKFHADLQCSNTDGSFDIGLWQINDYPWRADSPFDKCNGVTCTRPSSDTCCTMRSKIIEDMALDKTRATDYAWKLWRNSGFSFRRWSAYGSTAFWARYPSALAYVDMKYPNCVSKCSLINETLVCPPESTGPISKLPVEVITSGDPNDKVGDVGVGSGRYLSGTQGLTYSIYFDNIPTASAPAQKVIVTDQLNKEAVDLTTLSLGAITFVDKLVKPPAGPLVSLGDFTTDVDLRPGKNLTVKITAALNQTTGVLTWAYTSLDPITGQPTTNPLAGFLPAGTEGSVSFAVLPRPAATGTQITNKATIVFDTNSAIDTPVWLNTIDRTSPISKVSSLLLTQTSTNFKVQWGGTDAGSGIRDFTVYVSDNNSPFTAWQTHTPTTQATFTGLGGHSYRFYSIARDLVGNVEPPKTVGEASTQIAVSTAPQIVVTHTLTRNAQNNIVANLMLANTGRSTALTTLVTMARIGTTFASSITPAAVDIAAGASAPVQVVLPGSMGSPGTSAILTVGGTYVGGSFSFNARITLP